MKKLLRALIWAAVCLAPHPLLADPAVYEPGVDPGVGFNLVSWANFGGSGASIWENAVQSAYDAGFDDISLSPVRFYTPGVGSIAATSNSGPELSHVAAGVARAKQLGMRVTVNPFVEPAGFSSWRGFYDPAPGSAESNTFWADYEQYLTDVADMAQTNGADSMTVGTELRAITRNAGNNTKWNSVINAVDARFGGSIGYAANWDNYNHPNVATAIWEHSAVDFVGIDSYFTNVLSNTQADQSGSYPNATFIGQVESAWNNKLNNEILPYAAARQGGAGLPVEFTEAGYLPYNRTSVTPQNSNGSLDQDEQNMVFEGLMRALDGRLAAGEFLATHIWQWDMPGSAGSLWNMNPSGGNQPNNQQTAAWLSNFVGGNIDPPDPPGGRATTVLYSFENGLEGFSYPNFETEPASVLTQAIGTGATVGNASLAITKPTSPWTWDARVQMTGPPLEALQQAVDDGVDNYVLELDVTYVADDLPANLTDMNLHVSFQTTPGFVWSQAFPFADISGPTDQTMHVEIPFGAFSDPNAFSSSITGSTFHIGFAGSWTGDATVYIDRIALTNLNADTADFDADGDVDGADYLAWQQNAGAVGGATLAQGDANGDGQVDAEDLTVWQSQVGIELAAAVPAVAVPEPAAAMWIAAAVCATGIGRPRNARARASGGPRRPK